MSPHQDINRLEDWVAETHESISARLEGAKAAQSQTRLTLATMAIISVMMLTAAYNAYLSYDYYWIIDGRCPPEGTAAKEPNKEHDKEANIFKEQAYRDWAASRTVLISLLGIRVSVDDAAVLGTAVLFVLSLWLFLVARRENHTIGFLLRDTDTHRHASNVEPSVMSSAEKRPEVYSDGERWLIYHTIVSNNLFVIFDRLPPVSTLAGPNSLTATSRLKDKDNGRLDKLWLKLIRNFFFWFPVIVSLVVFGLDSWSYFRLDPFGINCVAEGGSKFFWNTRLAFLGCWIPLMICCMKSNRYSRSTENVLRRYGRKLFKTLKRKQSMKS